MGFCDYDDAWLRALTRERRAQARARLHQHAEPVRYAKSGPELKDTWAISRWKNRQWSMGHRRCDYCGCKMTRKPNRPDTLTCDHREPRRGGWTDGPEDPSNWAMACYRCNQRKGDMPEAEFRALLAD